jgi:hypothetical protein
MHTCRPRRSKSILVHRLETEIGASLDNSFRGYPIGEFEYIMQTSRYALLLISDFDFVNKSRLRVILKSAASCTAWRCRY